MKKSEIDITKEYLQSIGIGNDLISTIQDCKEILFLRLPEVCTMKINRPWSASKQTHIHITGDGMRFFYKPEDFTRNSNDLQSDMKQDILLLEKNLKNLSERAKIDHSEERNVDVSSSEEVLKTYTCKKFGHNGSQVQISKIRYDGQKFLELRKCLFTNDALVFIRLQDNSVLAVGIPNSYLSENDASTINVYNEIKNFDKSDNSERALRKVNYGNIASFNPNDEDDDESNTNFDLSKGISTRKKRTERHQDIVKLIALDLERAGYELYENPVDCLAVRANDPALLFEVKTLDGTSSDERKQVLKAFSQLYYYENFNVCKFTHNKIQKIAVFEKKISDEHILFFNRNGIKVYWVCDNIHLQDSNGIVRFI